MIEEEFVATVAAMRVAQKRYFKERTQHALVESKRLEHEVDKLIDDYLLAVAPAQPVQITLIDGRRVSA